MEFRQDSEYMTCMICILQGVNGLEMDEIGQTEISKLIAIVQVRDSGSRGGAE